MTAILESFSIDDGYGSENVTLKMNSRFSNVSAFIPVCLKCQKVGEFPGVDCLGTAPKFRKRKKNSSSLVYVFHKTWNYAFSRRSRAKKAMKCTKKCDARANVLLCLTSLLSSLFSFRNRTAERRGLNLQQNVCVRQTWQSYSDQSTHGDFNYCY